MGQKLQYETPDEMQAIIYLYFEDCKKNRDFLKAKPEKVDPEKEGAEVKSPVKPDTITDDLHPSISGLGVVLGLSRQGLINYEGRDEYVDTVRQAKSGIEAYNEQGLQQNVHGIIFNLKNNFNWKDRQEFEHSGDIGSNGGVCRLSEILQGFIETRQNDNDEGTVQE